MAGVAVAAAAAIAIAWLVGARRPDPDRLWLEAELALQAGRWQDARFALRRIERLRPLTSRDRALQAQVAIAAGRADDALATLDRIPDSDPLAGQARLLAGRLERQRGRVRVAESYLRRALEVDPELIEARKELIFIYGVQLRRGEVDAQFRALAKRTSLTHHDLFTWAMTHFTTWRPDIAEDLERFVAADPDDRASRLALAEILVDQPGMGDRVTRLLDALPSSDPDALALRIRLAFQQGQLAEAEAMLARGPEEHAGLARLRGRLAMLRNDPATAIRHYRRALSKEPFDRTTAFDLGQALALAGDRPAAESYLARVRPLNELYNLVARVRSTRRENEPPDLLKLARACEEAGLVEESRGWYRLAIARDPTDARAQAGLYRLGERSRSPRPGEGQDAGSSR
jgi:tetratricopeptide (TPR) repeat protein